MKNLLWTALMAAPLVFAQSATAKSGAFNWPQPGINAQHTAFNDAETILSTGNVAGLKQQWSFVTGALISVPPVLKGGLIYAMSNDGILYALREKSGAVAWSYPAYPDGEDGNYGVTVDGKSVFVNCQIDAGHFDVCALNAKTGKVLWTYAITKDGDTDVDSNPYNAPVVDHGLVFIGEADNISFGHVGYMMALDAKTGLPVWGDGNCANLFNDCNYISSAPVAVDNGLVVYGTGSSINGTNICARAEETGAAVWCSEDIFDLHHAVTIANGKVLFASQPKDMSSTYVEALNLNTGAMAWQTVVDGQSISSPYLAPAAANGVAYYATGGENNLYAVSMKKGKVLWKYKGKGPAGGVTSSPSFANGVLYAQCFKGLCAFDAATGSLLFSQDGKGTRAAPIVADGEVITVCNFDSICLYSLKN